MEEILDLIEHESYDELEEKIQSIGMHKVIDMLVSSKCRYVPEYIYRFAYNIEGAPIDRLLNELIKIEDVDCDKRRGLYICFFAENIKGVPIEKLADEVIKTKKSYYIYYFAMNVKGAPIEKLADAMIELKKEKHIFNFLMDVEGAPIEKLVEALVKTNNKEYKPCFAKQIERISDAIRKVKSENLDNKFDKKARLYELLNNNKIDEIKESKEEYKKLSYCDEES